MHSVQHKREAYYFYRFLSIFYDNFVNPFFWTRRMREQALELAQLDNADLQVIDVGSGTGFTTLGVVDHVDAANVVCIDQSPHQMAKARQKAALQQCTFRLGDAEDLPFEDDSFDRYVSAGSIEYWPEPQRGIAEAYRVLKPGGVALMIGPLRPQNKIARFVADTWMLFPEEEQYVRWFENAGFVDLQQRMIRPSWVTQEKYGIALAGVKPAAGKSPAALPTEKIESVDQPLSPVESLRLTVRLLIGSLAGFLFIPMALIGYLNVLLHRIGGGDSADAEDQLTMQQKASLAALAAGALWLVRKRR